jgi:hypothetical protein
MENLAFAIALISGLGLIMGFGISASLLMEKYWPDQGQGD